MTAGYMIPLPFDVYVRQKGNSVEINSSYNGETDLILQHDVEQHYMYPIGEEYYPVAFKWNSPWTVQTKRGWSTLFCAPMYHDLPFLTLSGIVDTDKHPIPVNFPFFLRKDFEGIISKGTPIVQCIPMKREKIIASVGRRVDSILMKWKRATTQAFDRYKNYFHAPKTYVITETNTSPKCPFAKFFNKQTK
jgi:hypothetical protein